MAAWWRTDRGGVLVAVRVTPRAATDAIAGLHTGADGTVRLAVTVRAAPEGGAARRAAAEAVARRFGVPKSGAEVVAGHAARLKTVRLAVDPAAMPEEP